MEQHNTTDGSTTQPDTTYEIMITLLELTELESYPKLLERLYKDQEIDNDSYEPANVKQRCNYWNSIINDTFVQPMFRPECKADWTLQSRLMSDLSENQLSDQYDGSSIVQKFLIFAEFYSWLGVFREITRVLLEELFLEMEQEVRPTSCCSVPTAAVAYHKEFVLPAELLVQCFLHVCGRELFKNVSLVCSYFASIINSESFCKEKLQHDTRDIYIPKQLHQLLVLHKSSWRHSLAAHWIAKTKAYLIVWALLDKPHQTGVPTFWEFSKEESYTHFHHIWEGIYLTSIKDYMAAMEIEEQCCLTDSTQFTQQEKEENQPKEKEENKTKESKDEEETTRKRKREEETEETKEKEGSPKRLMKIARTGDAGTAEAVISGRFLDELNDYLDALAKDNPSIKCYQSIENNCKISEVTVILDELMAEWGLGKFKDCFRSERMYKEFLERELQLAKEVNGWVIEYIRLCGNILIRERKGFALISLWDANYCIIPMPIVTFLRRLHSPLFPIRIWKF